MTKETLQEANRLSHAIFDFEAQIKIVEEMQHSDNNLVLEVDTIGVVRIPSVLNELKDDILNMMLEQLNNAKGILEDKLRML